MSINANMKKVDLQACEEIIMPSLARKKKWIDKGECLVSIYETDNRTNTNNAVYNESSHIGLTFNKSINSNYRLKDGEKVYTVNGAIPKGRLNQLFLKVIENA